MRVLMVAHSDAPWTPHFCRFFLARGDALKLVSFAPFPLDGIDGVDMEFVGAEPFDMRRNKHTFFTRVPRIRRIARLFKPDMVYAPYLSSNGLSAALAWSGPLAVTAVGSDVAAGPGRGGLKRRLRESSIRYVCRRADIINTVSQALGDRLVGLGVPEDKILQLPFGADVERFRPTRDAARPEAHRLICTRKHEPIYDIPTIIRALARLRADGRAFHCTFTCGGTNLDDHKRQAHEAGLDDCVTFTGQVPFASLPGMLADADVYISASHSDGTSVALLEAMATGVLPVVTRIPANEPWIEDDETGLLFDKGDDENLASRLARALDDAALRQRAFETNRLRVERDASMTGNMTRLAEAFEKLIAGRATQGL